MCTIALISALVACRLIPARRAQVHAAVPEPA
jgi:hypothetical protein